MASVSLDNIEKRFGKIKVIHGISFGIADGEFVVLVGPPGHFICARKVKKSKTPAHGLCIA